MSRAGPALRGRGGALGRAGGRGCGRSLVADLDAAAVAGLRGRGRIQSGAMSVDKAELCGSLLTWVGRGRGQGQVYALSSRPVAPTLALCTLPFWGREEEGVVGLPGRCTLA